MTNQRLIRSTAAALAAWALLAWPAPVKADAVEDFYRGQTIRLYVSVNVGGAYDTVARMFARTLSNHLPGRPAILVVNMPGASGLTMSNWLYNVGPKDGTAIGLANIGMPMSQLTAPAQVRYDANKFQWLGNLEESTGTLFTYHTSPTKTFADARRRETTMGVTSRSSILYQLLALSNRLLDSRFKIIFGYDQNRIVSIERGEIEGSASSFENLTGLAPRWLKENLINILVVNAPRRLEKYPDTPTMLELTDSPEHREVLEFMMLQSSTSRAFFVAPEVPAARVEALRRGFDRTARDPAFIADMTRATFELQPSTGAQTQAAVARLLATSPAIAARLVEAVK